MDQDLLTMTLHLVGAMGVRGLTTCAWLAGTRY
jgi:hypothetical protein